MTDLIAELAEELRRINAYCELPDGDGVSMSVALWAERWADRLHESHATLTRILTDDAAIRAAHTELVIRLGEVTTELEAAKRDAARYRFIRSSDADADQPYVARHGQTDWGKFYDQWLMEDDADNAIDAAMRDSAREGGDES